MKADSLVGFLFFQTTIDLSCAWLGPQIDDQKEKTSVNIKHAIAMSGLALLIAGSPALASAADMQSGPIHINHVYLSGGFSSNSYGDEATILPGAANVSFTNESTAAATTVVFALEAQGYVVDRFTDAGSFAPGVAIHHSFPETQIASDMHMAVAQATFADGTAWQNPDVPLPDVKTYVGVPVSRF